MIVQKSTLKQFPIELDWATSCLNQEGLHSLSHACFYGLYTNAIGEIPLAKKESKRRERESVMATAFAESLSEDLAHNLLMSFRWEKTADLVLRNLLT